MAKLSKERGGDRDDPRRAHVLSPEEWRQYIDMKTLVVPALLGAVEGMQNVFGESNNPYLKRAIERAKEIMSDA